MSEALTSLLAIPAVGAAIAGLIAVASKALERRSRSWTATLNAKAALLDAEAQKLLAEARVRESQARITESDATALRDAFAAARKELADAREEIRNVLQANEEERTGRAWAEERASRMHADFHAFFAEARAGRLPKHTPPSFKFEHTQPYGVTR